VFVDSGRHKLFVDLAGFSNFFVELGIPFPYIMAVVVASIEFGGGLCLILVVLGRSIHADSGMVS
jgi:uncharacterized membrane protein YphA (DoxX/SURF4 family)